MGKGVGERKGEHWWQWCRSRQYYVNYSSRANPDSSILFSPQPGSSCRQTISVRTGTGEWGSPPPAAGSSVSLKRVFKKRWRDGGGGQRETGGKGGRKEGRGLTVTEIRADMKAKGSGFKKRKKKKYEGQGWRAGWICGDERGRKTGEQWGRSGQIWRPVSCEYDAPRGSLRWKGEKDRKGKEGAMQWRRVWY